VAIDDEGGRVTAMGALGRAGPLRPHAGAARGDEAEAFGADSVELARSIDVDWVFAPVVDLDARPATG
jgi:beta-glucosidase-like glycosyl hydrolase